MNSRIQLALLRNLERQRQGHAKAFTLVELMIVVSVIGILSALVIPQYLQARTAAAQGTDVGEALGLAKECATFVESGGIGAAPTTVENSTVTCTLPSNGGTIATTFTGGGAAGIKCLTATSATGQGTVTVTVASTGSISCAFS